MTNRSVSLLHQLKNSMSSLNLVSTKIRNTQASGRQAYSIDDDWPHQILDMSTK